MSRLDPGWRSGRLTPAERARVAELCQQANALEVEIETLEAQWRALRDEYYSIHDAALAAPPTAEVLPFPARPRRPDA